MSTQTSVWIMIATDGVSDKIRDLVDSGYFAEAKDLDYQLKSISEKLDRLVGEKGGNVKLSTYDRQVLELPVTIAEELPLILAGYRQVFGSLMSVGIGLDLREAAIAARKSTLTNDIEMYDPADESFRDLAKTLQIEDELFGIQPNLYDERFPKDPPPDADATTAGVGKYVPGLNAQQALEAENAIVQATVQQLMGPAQAIQQQAQQQAEQAQQAQGPDSLLEALSGEKKKDSPSTETKQKKDSGSDKDDDKDSGSDDDSDESDDSDDSDATTKKLGDLLSDVQEKMPKLMELHEKNPEAFKKVVALIHKLVGVVKSRKSDKSDTKKSEITSMMDDLNKAIRLHYPVGTVKNRKKKVMIQGKARWRSVAAGQVKDQQGNAISVQSHNASADGEEGARG